MKVLSWDCSNSVTSSGSTSVSDSLAISTTSAVISFTEIFFFICFDQRIIALQCCVGFCHITTWFSYKWQPPPVFLPGESQGQRSLVGCCLWGRTESDTTEGLSIAYVYPLPLESPSHPSPSHPSRSSQSTMLSSFPLAIYFTHICQCYSLSSSHPLLPLLCPKSVLCVCVSIPALPIGSSVPFF